MKFRAVMIDASPMREFANIVTTISKLSKECVLRLSNDQLYFIVSDENSGPGPPVLWCEIPQTMFFSEYQVIGIDEEHPDIYLGLVSANLSKSLATLKSAKALKMKLTKQQCPCLTLEIEMPSSTSQQTRQVTHDLPVVVVPRKMWSEFQEPRIPVPDVYTDTNFDIWHSALGQLEDLNIAKNAECHINTNSACSILIVLPPLKQLRTTVDRMRTMSSEVIIRASADGRFTLQIKTDMAKVSTRFKDLGVEAFEGPIDHSDSETESQLNEDLSKICYCRVDAKKLSMFLSADHISHHQAVCSIVHKKLVVLCLMTVENVKLQCFIMGIVY